MRFIGGIIHRIVNKFHYYFTYLHCIRYTKIPEFRQSLKKITGYIMGKEIHAAFIRIAEPGGVLIKKHIIVSMILIFTTEF
jgi:hypothetical protein